MKLHKGLQPKIYQQNRSWRKSLAKLWVLESMSFDPTLQCLTGYIKLAKCERVLAPSSWQKLLTAIEQSCAKPFGQGTEASRHIWQWKAFQPVQTFADTAAETLGMRDLDLGPLSIQRCSSCKTFIHLHLNVSYKSDCIEIWNTFNNWSSQKQTVWKYPKEPEIFLGARRLSGTWRGLQWALPLSTKSFSSISSSHGRPFAAMMQTYSTVGCSSACACSFAMQEWWTTGFRLKIESRIISRSQSLQDEMSCISRGIGKAKTWFLSIWRVFACWHVPSPANGQVSSPSPRHWRLKNKVNTSAQGGEVTQKMTLVPATH